MSSRRYGWRSLPRCVTGIGGGLPVLVDGQIVAAIGVSSGTSDEDVAVAQAGIDALLAG